LEANGDQIYYTRTNDIYESVSQKAAEANRSGAIFFASIHRNGADTPTANGFETLVYDNSGKAKACADSANSSMASLGFRNRGTKTRKDLTVLNSTRMEAVLFEVGFITNAGDNSLFDSKFEQIAQGLAKAIAIAVESNISNIPTPSPAPSPAPTPSTGSDDLKFTYSVRAGGKIWPEVVDLSDWAGKADGVPITDIAIRANMGSVKYRVHLKDSKIWLPWVTGYDWKEPRNGYAGNGTPIDAVQVYYYTPEDYAKKKGYLKAQYRVSPIGSDGFYPWQFDIETGNGQDGYAGVFGKAIDKFQLY